jgi:2-dehydropantoate 2-reductase
MILVIGPGAVGSFLGWTLARGGEAVELLGRSGVARFVDASVSGSAGAAGAQGAAGVWSPIRLGSPIQLAGSGTSVSAVPELILIAVKMPDLAGAIEGAARWPEATVVAVQNGVGAEDLLLAQRPRGGLIAASLTTSVERSPDGSIQRLSRGGIVLAPVRGNVTAAIGRLINGLVAGGLRARRTADPVALRWSKLLVNLMGNATGAITDLEPSAVYRDPILFGIERRQAAEALAEMAGLHVRPVRLFGADARLLPIAARLPGRLVQPILVRVVAAGRGGKRPSLHLHLDAGAGAPSEVDWLNGAVARAAVARGTTAPVNARLAEILDACNRDPERRAWFRGRPDRLLEAVSAE